MNAHMTTIILLCLSNVFMTFAWYGHLRMLSVFIPFSIFYLKEKFSTDYIYAGLCILMAVSLLPKLSALSITDTIVPEAV